MSSSRVEINFRRLLSKCESMVADSTSFDWRTENYVESLQQQLLELCNQPSSSTPELLTEYTRRVDFLNGLVKADRLPSASEKALASQLLVPSHMPNRERLTATEELHLQKTSHYTQQMRDELLGRTDGSPGGGLRHRGRQKEKEEEEEGTEDIDVLLRHHERAQEKLAEEMLTFAQTLKHNSLAAHHIITDDTKVSLSKDVESTHSYLANLTFGGATV
ncbi:PREDICTED: vesicle transport protein USE1-like [Priapulus caudatus]|uniref:Vesicle transport protein USE1 n=1 Tax=Priapulus caudatus TaxID=37621 RepID=A0ABM1E6W7_PRICU|nr:PREDICTED: vesicle transport protein USE1-like [Priapulus caudatus]